MHVIIVGAGVSGLSSAFYLRSAGATVTVLDRQPGPGLETSFANGALLHPSFVGPWNSFATIGLALSQGMRRRSWLRVSPSALAAAPTWAWQFCANSFPSRVRATTRANLALALHSSALLQDVEQSTGIEFGHARTGAIVAYRSHRKFKAAEADASRAEASGLMSRVITGAAIAELEPALEPILPQLAGIIHFLRDNLGDAHAFCNALHTHLASIGVDSQFATDVESLARVGTRVSGVRLRSGQTLDADAVLLGAGSHTPSLLSKMGVRIPVRPVKGFSLTLSPGDEAFPRLPVIDAAAHIAAVPLVRGGLRIAGLADISGFDLELSRDRLEALRSLASKLYPRILATCTNEFPAPWAGLRAVSADGAPLIGPTRADGLYLNTGHGHFGWTTALAAGQMAADAILGRSSPIASAPFDPRRFR